LNGTNTTVREFDQSVEAVRSLVW